MIKHFFNNLSIQNKLLLITIATTAFALLIGTEHRSARLQIENELLSIAGVLSHRSVVAVEFEDRKLAMRNLEALNSVPQITQGCLYRRVGRELRLLALYLAHPLAQDRVTAEAVSQYPGEHCPAAFAVPATYQHNGAYTRPYSERVQNQKGEFIHLQSPIALNGEVIGYLYINASTHFLDKRMFQHVQRLVVIALLALSLCTLLAYLMQRMVSIPIQSLAKIADQIRLENNYGLRAPKQFGDETGQLIDCFNAMLDRMEENNTKLTASEERFRLLTELSPAGVFQLDTDGTLIYANECWREITQVDLDCPPSIDGWLDNVQSADRPRVEGLWRRTTRQLEPFSTEFRVTGADGGIHSVVAQSKKVINSEGVVLGLLGLLFDITELKEAQLKLEKLALYDTLTGLANRYQLRTRLDSLLLCNHSDHSSSSNSSSNSMSVVLFFLDLDNFKRINDTLGHDFGDKILVELAERLKRAVRSDDLVARLGGGEFTILAEVGAIREAVIIAEKVVDTVSAPMMIDNREIAMTTSIGIAFGEGGAEGSNEVGKEEGAKERLDATQLLKNADLAMYRAKAAGKNQFCIFSVDMEQAMAERMRIEEALQRALEEKQFIIHYQPQVDLSSCKIAGMEALVRWQHPTRGLLYPGEFIEIAEETGLILRLGEWVFEECCRELEHLTQLSHLPDDFLLAINLSARQFNDKELASRLMRTLKKYKVPPEKIELEITETTVMEDISDAVLQLHALKDLGLTISIDDFGTGYSSLSQLKQLPIDIVKVDRSFISDIPDNGESMAITSSVITMAHLLDLKVVAEGVETKEQLAFLRENRCDIIQGFIISGAVPLNRNNLSKESWSAYSSIVQ